MGLSPNAPSRWLLSFTKATKKGSVVVRSTHTAGKIRFESVGMDEVRTGFETIHMLDSCPCSNTLARRQRRVTKHIFRWFIFIRPQNAMCLKRGDPTNDGVSSSCSFKQPKKGTNKIHTVLRRPHKCAGLRTFGQLRQPCKSSAT